MHYSINLNLLLYTIVMVIGKVCYFHVFYFLYGNSCDIMWVFGYGNKLGFVAIVFCCNCWLVCSSIISIDS